MQSADRPLHRALLGLAASLVAVTWHPGSALAGVDGFALGFDLLSSHVEDEGDNGDDVFVEDTGAGAALWVGYGFTPSFAARLFLSGAGHDTNDDDIGVGLGGATLEAMYLFRNPEPFRPYILGGFGGFGATSRVDELEFETNGPGTALGTGFCYFFNETFALDLGLRAEFINWEEASATLETPEGTVTIEMPIEEESSTVKLLLGGTFWL